MASELNLGRNTDTKPVKVERGHVVYSSEYDPLNPGKQGPAYSPVIGDNEVNMPWMKGEVKCGGGGPAHDLPVVQRVHMVGKEGPVNLCEKHWIRAQKQGTIDFDKPITEVNSFSRDPEQHHDINKEDYQIRLGKSNRDAASVFESTGRLRNVRTTGRPAVPSSDTQDALDRAATGGGHLPKNHAELLGKAYTALLHSKSQNDDHPEYGDYASKAKELMSEEDHRHIPAYFDYAQTHHRKLTGESAVPPESREETVRRAQILSARNGGKETETYEDLMGSDIAPQQDEFGRSSRKGSYGTPD